jgi:hypothetical protein
MANRYWVGGSGNWNTTDTTHWSATSGGASGAAVPTSADNVFFDANSFSATGQTVTVPASNSNPTCLDMNWTGALYNPTLSNIQGAVFSIYGSLTFISAMTLLLSNEGFFTFLATSTGKTIDFAGQVITPVVPGENIWIRFSGTGGGWTLQSDILGSTFIEHRRGTLDTNSKNINCAFFDAYWNSSAHSTILGASTITCTYDEIYEEGGWADFGGDTGVTLDAGTSHLVIVNRVNDFFSLLEINSGFTLYDVTIDSLGCDFFSAVSCHDLTATPGSAIEFLASSTNIITGELRLIGTSSSNVSIFTSLAGSAATISKASGIVVARYASIKDSTATGGATFYAPNSTSVSGNTGWSFTEAPARYPDAKSTTTFTSQTKSTTSWSNPSKS